MTATIEISPITVELLDSFGSLLAGQGESDGCWCMWFISRVADYHARGAAGNRAEFVNLMSGSETPLGLLARKDGEAVGWCAVGPRSRYDRAVKTPTMRGRDAAEDNQVWFVPCFLIRRDVRRRGFAKALLNAAVALAEKHGALAVEGFPLAGGRTRSKSADFMTGTETLFASCGFVPTRRPSDNRVIMRLDLR